MAEEHSVASNSGTSATALLQSNSSSSGGTLTHTVKGGLAIMGKKQTVTFPRKMNQFSQMLVDTMHFNTFMNSIKCQI